MKKIRVTVAAAPRISKRAAAKPLSRKALFGLSTKAVDKAVRSLGTDAPSAAPASLFAWLRNA
ncbi:MAG: hypothetical protein ACK59Y_03320 [Betaproteobacteria bacterium]|nr:hypothetical protein [Betaproteobacteria bacterium]